MAESLQLAPVPFSSLQKWATCLVSTQSLVELTLAASIGLDGDGDSGYPGEDTGFVTSLWTGVLCQGWREGHRFQTDSFLEPAASQRCPASVLSSYFFSLLLRRELPPRVHPPAPDPMWSGTFEGTPMLSAKPGFGGGGFQAPVSTAAPGFHQHTRCSKSRATPAEVFARRGRSC